MIKEPKKVDFFTTGKQPSMAEFFRISEWIRQDKQKKNRKKQKPISARKGANLSNTTKSEV